ncbi:MAG: dehydrogenase [Alphaproteobacteria bacterium RIFCSPLOWO2_01_FULL_40_26]|nr:MAG: dehydrogenase [Alphaproteobacteria bacterium RIFCSPHIGHO2_02_FULL_40_34]OFW94863.1 MAG: dehydrogenase [Alphaproteobacteria bacterium RIFCSPLOWO2_01_FULL_40_26]OFX10489.1 MAG: dehydrogenase [Alphaproteobacteria bacterium RIFCSPLOWO2_02_FULL_40_19]OFX11063.1 MAG: dehydrogenase [Alphaproteobacteria bacterium RIFCSPLOWO2_12_FULL_40_11]
MSELFLIRSRSPLRLGLAGGGTDMEAFYLQHGGCVLNATIDLYACCTIKPKNDGKICFVASDINEEFETEITNFIEPEGNLKLHKAIYNRIVKDFNHSKPLGAFKMTTYCDSPPGSGLGSSSTLTVSIVKAYVEWLSIPFGDYDIAQLAYDIERRELKMKGGKQDQYAATFGGVNFMEFYGDDKTIINPLKVRRWIMSELEQSLILFYTGVSRESHNIIEEQSKNIEEKTGNTLEMMTKIKQEAYDMKEALLKGNIMEMAESMRRGWEAKKASSTKISNSNIDRIYDVAMNAGAMAGKVSGAGGGGFFMFLVPPSKRMKILRLFEQEKNGRTMPCHFVDEGSQSWRINK